MDDTARWQQRNEEAEALEAQGQDEAAARLYEANLAEGCDLAATFERLAVLYRRRGDYEREAAVMEQAVALVGRNGVRHAAYERRLAAAWAHARERAAAPEAEAAPAGRAWLLVVMLVVLALMVALGLLFTWPPSL